VIAGRRAGVMCLHVANSCLHAPSACSGSSETLVRETHEGVPCPLSKWPSISESERYLSDECRESTRC